MYVATILRIWLHLRIHDPTNMDTNMSQRIWLQTYGRICIQIRPYEYDDLNHQHHQ